MIHSSSSGIRGQGHVIHARLTLLLHQQLQLCGTLPVSNPINHQGCTHFGILRTVCIASRCSVEAVLCICRCRACIMRAHCNAGTKFVTQ